MKPEIIFWLNPKTGNVYHRIYTNSLFYEVGKENNYGHVILGIGIIQNKKLNLVNKGTQLFELYKQNEHKEKIKNKIIDYLIDKLEKKKG